MDIPEREMEKIVERSKMAWPDDRDMQRYSVKEEIDGYRRFHKLSWEGIPESTRAEIINRTMEYSNSWDKISSSIESEIRAFQKLNCIDYGDVPPEIIKRWLSEVENEYSGYYILQLEEVTKKLNKHTSIMKTRMEIDPIKGLLIELEKIVGSECFNGNIQNYNGWGELESEGRSFRYPVKFYNGKMEYKEWNVRANIPSEELITGYYPFGANELNIYRALHKVIKHLEEHYGFNPNKT